MAHCHAADSDVRRSWLRWSPETSRCILFPRRRKLATTPRSTTTHGRVDLAGRQTFYTHRIISCGATAECGGYR